MDRTWNLPTTAMAFALLTLALVASAGAAALPDLDDLNVVAASTTRTAAAKTPALKPVAKPTFDLVVSANDRLVNRLVALGLKKATPSPSGKRLTALALSFREAGVAHIQGTFAMEATAATKKAEFDFVIDCALGSSQTTDIVFDILEASVRLNDVEVFHSTRTNPQPVGALLDFLAPAIESAVEGSLRRAGTSMEERFAAARPKADLKVADVLYVEGNRVGIKVLPHLLSPLLPPLVVGRIAVTNGMLQIALSISEVKP